MSYHLGHLEAIFQFDRTYIGKAYVVPIQTQPLSLWLKIIAGV